MDMVAGGAERCQNGCFHSRGVRIGPPPDLPLLLLHNRIVYVDMPLVPAVTELIIAELLYPNYESAFELITINLSGSTIKEQPVNLFLLRHAERGRRMCWGKVDAFCGSRHLVDMIVVIWRPEKYLRLPLILRRSTFLSWWDTSWRSRRITIHSLWYPTIFARLLIMSTQVFLASNASNVRFVPVGINKCGDEVMSDDGLDRRHEFCELAMKTCLWETDINRSWYSFGGLIAN